ncbi:acyltransferase family protein [Mycobacterium sp. URHB0021]
MVTRYLTATTLAATFDPRANSLNALRLLFASAVIVSHSWPLTGREPQPHFGGAYLGSWAVFGFFGISGFLITRSRLNGRPARDFYLARGLRIMPAFIVALLVVAFVFAPLSELFDPIAVWHPVSSITYVLHNLPLYPPAPFPQPGIADTLANVPFPRNWDGPLWTLYWEAWCYIGIGVMASLLPRKALPIATVIGFVVLTGVALAGRFGAPIPEMTQLIVWMIIAFISGMLLLLFGDRIRVNAVHIATAIVVFAVAIAVNLGPHLGALPMAYLVLVLGNVLPLSKVGAKFDISYGVYIYAWPVQQLVVLTGGARMPLIAYILIVFIGTLPLAFLSSWLVEPPAMRLKHRSIMRVAEEAPTP